MTESAKQEITILLKNLKEGDKSTQNEIMQILYKELRGFAGSILNKENQTITFQATELVNEAYLRMFDSKQLDWTDRTHFMSTAVVVMRRFLVDHARKKNSQKRISKKNIISFEEELFSTGSLEVDIVRLNDALSDLEQLDIRQAKIVEMRFFGGLTGHQGALRTMFLIKSGLNKNAFIATGIAIAMFVDISRLSVYFGKVQKINIQNNLGIIATATLCAFAGAFLGKKLLQKVTITALQYLVSAIIGIVSILLIFGII